MRDDMNFEKFSNGWKRRNKGGNNEKKKVTLRDKRKGQDRPKR